MLHVVIQYTDFLFIVPARGSVCVCVCVCVYMVQTRDSCFVYSVPFILLGDDI